MSHPIDELVSPAVTEILAEDDTPPAYPTAILTIVEYVGEDGAPYLAVLHDHELPVWRAIGILTHALEQARGEITALRLAAEFLDEDTDD